MDPCHFVRVLIGNLAIKLPVAAKPGLSGVHPSSAPCFCVIKLKNFPDQTATVPLLPPNHRLVPDSHLQTLSASFNLTQTEIRNLTASGSSARLKICVYAGRPGFACCWNRSGKLLGRVSVPLDLKAVEATHKPCVFQNGWVSMGNKDKTSPQLYLNVKAQPDPRFVFRFGGEPECSPQVFQIQGTKKQPVFTCRFGFRNHSFDHNRSSSATEKKKAQAWRERKGWSVTVHDLSGSPVAAASMVTPFVPSPGSDQVSRSNPGAWLILRHGNGAWKPWGRLEAWRERGGASDGLGYRFALVPDGGGPAGITLADSTLSPKKGGKFTVDDMTAAAAGNSPFTSPGGSFDLGSVSWSGSGSGSASGSWSHGGYRGFVMSSTVEAVGKGGRPEVEVGVDHVTCTEDAAGFVALAAAVDLSVDACRLFSQKLRKELRQECQDCAV